MMCQKMDCRGQLRITHTYTVGLQKFQRAICTGCTNVYRLSTMASIVTARGDGAKAHAARAKKPSLCDTPPSAPF